MTAFPPASLRPQGFILVATIWMLATIAIVASAFALWVQQSIELVGEQTERTQSSLDMISTKSTLLYLLATHVKNEAGLTTSVSVEPNNALPRAFIDPMSLTLPPITGEEIKVDNRAYNGVESAIFSMQDEAGLININSPNGLLLEGLLLELGLNDRQKKGLIDKLADYIDEDDFNRVRGAESFHYSQAGLSRPPNKKLKSPFELLNVMGWKNLIQANPGMLDHLTAASVSLININTASQAVLSLLPELDTNKANRIIQARDEHAFNSLYTAGKATGLSLDIYYESLRTTPSSYTRLYLWYKKSRLVEQFSIQLTPSSRVGKPWKNQ